MTLRGQVQGEKGRLALNLNLTIGDSKSLLPLHEYCPSVGQKNLFSHKSPAESVTWALGLYKQVSPYNIQLPTQTNLQPGRRFQVVLLGIGDRRVAPQLELLELRRRRRVVGMVVDETVSGGFLIHVGGSCQLQKRIRMMKMHERGTLWILRSMAMTKCV